MRQTKSPHKISSPFIVSLVKNMKHVYPGLSVQLQVIVNEAKNGYNKIHLIMEGAEFLI